MNQRIEQAIADLPAHLERFSDVRVAILGDVCLDRFIYGEVERVSPEAPVPVVEFGSEIIKLGMGGNVAANLSSLGAKPVLIGLAGEDEEAELLAKTLCDHGIESELIQDPTRSTIVKTRIVAANQHVVRLDREKRHAVSSEKAGEILKALDRHLDEANTLIVQEHAKGLFTRELRDGVFDLCRKRGVPVCIDPNRSTRPEMYEGSRLITPNHSEFLQLCGVSRDSDPDLEELGHELRQRLKLEELIVTLGKQGMRLFLSDGSSALIPTKAREVFEVSGAGDTVMAALAVALASGCDLVQAAVIANYAAGVVVGKMGTSTVTREEILERLALD